MTPEQKPFSRRQLLKGAGAGGLAAALIPVLRQSEAPLGRLAAFGPAPAAGTEGTPEQVHLTWGEDPTSSVVVRGRRPGLPVGHGCCSTWTTVGPGLCRRYNGPTPTG